MTRPLLVQTAIVLNRVEMKIQRHLDHVQKKRRTMLTNGTSRVAAALFFLVLTCESVFVAEPNDGPAHTRPFFMPAEERTRIRGLIADQEWTQADYARIQAAARKGDGFLAAFLYALDGDPVYAPIAQKWLLGKFGAQSGTTRRARGALDNPEFFKAGMPHLSDVFYDTNFTPYRVSYRTEKAAEQIHTAAFPFHIVVNSVLEFVYRHPQRNVFRVSAQRYIAEPDMDSGLTRYLADDDDAVRLDGSPPFTFSDGKKAWLFEGCTNNSIWPTAVPAAVTAAPSAYGDCRYRMTFKPDRITVRMDAGWTRFDPTHFTVPGKWTSPEGTPAWARIIAVDDHGKEVEDQTALHQSDRRRNLTQSVKRP